MAEKREKKVTQSGLTREYKATTQLEAEAASLNWVAALVTTVVVLAGADVHQAGARIVGHFGMDFSGKPEADIVLAHQRPARPLHHLRLVVAEPRQQGIGLCRPERLHGLRQDLLVDALFDRNHAAVRRELLRWNPSTDNMFSILKLMLTRTDEIRKARVGYSHGLNDDEVLKLLNLEKRPPFVKKKISRRLHGEIAAYDDGVIQSIYEMLMDMQAEFRSGAPPAKQLLVFEEKVFRVIFETE